MRQRAGCKRLQIARHARAPLSVRLRVSPPWQLQLQLPSLGLLLH